MAEATHIPFHFHAGGNALSGVFERPFPHVIEAQASVTLPTIGGFAQARVENFRAHHFLSFKSAHTHVSGSRQNKDIVTINATSVIEGLDILGIVTADRVVSRVTSEYDSRTDGNININGNNKEAHIVALGSEFHNLRIAGQKVEVILRHDLLLRNKTFNQLRDNLSADKGDGREEDVYGEVVLCSLVEKIEPPVLAGVERIGRHILKIKHFGTISFAEVLASAGERTLTMMRIRLGCPDEGLLAVAESGSNGRPWPPAA
jgi:hypothetical protein